MAQILFPILHVSLQSKPEMQRTAQGLTVGGIADSGGYGALLTS
jgi:hypothetical protein